MQELVQTGRLPITAKNIEIIPESEELHIKTLIHERSSDAGLVILGFREEQLKHSGEMVFRGYEEMGTVLFVNTHSKKAID